MRKNQHNFVEFSRTKSKIRKRIETNISQLYGQFTINIICKNLSRFGNKNSIENNFFYDDSILEFFSLQKKFEQIKKLICAKCTTGKG